MTGQLATSKAGHDKGTLYVILSQEGGFVYLCDGRLKTPDKPKKKRVKHIQQINASVGEELLRKLQAGEKVYAEEIKYALRQYKTRGVCPQNESAEKKVIAKMEEVYVKK